MKIKRLKEEKISLINVLCAGPSRIKVISILKRLREIDTQITEKKRKKHSDVSALGTKECIDYYDKWRKEFFSKIHAVTIQEVTVPEHCLVSDLPDLKTEEKRLKSILFNIKNVNIIAVWEANAEFIESTKEALQKIGTQIREKKRKKYSAVLAIEKLYDIKNIYGVGVGVEFIEFEIGKGSKFKMNNTIFEFHCDCKVKAKRIE